MTTPTQQNPGSPSLLRWVERIAHLLAIAVFAILVARALRHAGDPFVGPHAFVSADVATTARTFSTQGVFHLHGIPVNNNPPVAAFDFYTHWPPLLPISMSLVMRAFGDSERTVHLCMLLIFIATAALIYLLGRKWMGPTAGALAAIFWMTLPVVLQFSDLASQQALTMLFVVAAFLTWEKRPWLGAILLFLGVLSSWEAALVAPALWLVARRHAEQKRSANLSLLAAAAGIGSVALLFLVGNHQIAIDTFQTARFYMGLSPVYSRLGFALPQQQLPLADQLRLTLLNNVWMLGPLGLAAALQVALARPAPLARKLLPLAAPWLIWCIVMHNHTARHHFEFLIAAPVIAFSLAWLATNGLAAQPKATAIRAAAILALTALQALLLPHPYISDGYDPAKLVAYGRAIKAATPPGSIVLAPLVSAVPLYYADRHIIRGIGSPEAAENALPEIHSAFPDAPVYLAIPPILAESFNGPAKPPGSQGKMPGAKIVSSTADVVIFKMD